MGQEKLGRVGQGQQGQGECRWGQAADERGESPLTRRHVPSLPEPAPQASSLPLCGVPRPSGSLSVVSPGRRSPSLWCPQASSLPLCGVPRPPVSLSVVSPGLRSPSLWCPQASGLPLCGVPRPPVSLSVVSPGLRSPSLWCAWCISSPTPACPRSHLPPPRCHRVSSPSQPLCPRNPPLSPPISQEHDDWPWTPPSPGMTHPEASPRRYMVSTESLTPWMPRRTLRIWPTGMADDCVPRAPDTEPEEMEPAGTEPSSPSVPPEQLFMALCDFLAQCAAELSISPGDWLFALKEEGNYILAHRLLGQPSPGLVPLTHITRATPDTLLDQLWYFSRISRTEAQQRLLSPAKAPGTFLIQPSESSCGDYSLSAPVQAQARVCHYRISSVAEGSPYLQKVRLFPSMEELLAYCKTNWKLVQNPLLQPCVSQVYPPAQQPGPHCPLPLLSIIDWGGSMGRQIPGHSFPQYTSQSGGHSLPSLLSPLPKDPEGCEAQLGGWRRVLGGQSRVCAMEGSCGRETVITDPEPQYLPDHPGMLSWFL
ncbi:proline-rich protein 36 [Loxodonta africana]|uniref:proline-rich protein 36 n=1 Tax=Loxodonta africana TaxID=9785 RepID=UPI0030D40196